MELWNLQRKYRRWINAAGILEVQVLKALNLQWTRKKKKALFTGTWCVCCVGSKQMWTLAFWSYCYNSLEHVFAAFQDHLVWMNRNNQDLHQVWKYEIMELTKKVKKVSADHWEAWRSKMTATDRNARVAATTIPSRQDQYCYRGFKGGITCSYVNGS